MKKNFIYLLLLLFPLVSQAQNVGIGVPVPVQKLDVDGAIKIGGSTTESNGSIRYQGGAFEGYDAGSWKAFTQLPAGTLVASAVNPNPALTSAGFTYFSTLYTEKSIFISTTPDTWLGVQTSNSPSQIGISSAIWTGSKMIVWGGRNQSGTLLNSGYSYDPMNNSWAPIADAPITSRIGHSTVWTGTHMIIWGGNNSQVHFNTGAAYDPATDSWSMLGMTNVPLGSTLHQAVWTGTEMIVWGGNSATGAVNTGAKYNFSTGAWTILPTALAPTPRIYFTAIWTGSKMIVWGGEDEGGTKNDGGIYDPVSNTWEGSTSLVNSPASRTGHSAVWTGTEMIVWGGAGDIIGFTNTGGKYNPNTDTWTVTNAPLYLKNRINHKALWTGTEMIVFGGDIDYSLMAIDGDRYNPQTDSWIEINVAESIPNSPFLPGSKLIVWTGDQLIVYGENDADKNTTLGSGRYIINSQNNVSVPIKSEIYLFSKN